MEDREWTLFMTTKCVRVIAISLAVYQSCYVQIRERSERRTEDQQILTDYLKHFELLLSCLAQGIRVVQEREVIYHGYLRWVQGFENVKPCMPTLACTSRPSHRVPVGRIESWAQRYHSLSLRKRLFAICCQGVELIRQGTRVLVARYVN